MGFVDVPYVSLVISELSGAFVEIESQHEENHECGYGGGKEKSYATSKD